MLSCPSCGAEVPEGFAFCGRCGTALAAAAGLEERRVVTVLFCDLAGFTARSDQADPEDVRALLRPYHARLRREIERFGGTLDKFIGVNTAARLEVVAPVGRVLVGEATYRATQGLFDYEPLPPVRVKGKAEPLPVWVAASARSRLGVVVEQGPATPFLGREAELGQLQRLLAETGRWRLQPLG
jgi:class 3 adenylate cyclase